MYPEQKKAFDARMARIQAGSANSSGTVLCGVQTDPTKQQHVPQGKKRRGASRRAIMAKGLRSAILQILILGTGLIVFIRFVGL